MSFEPSPIRLWKSLDREARLAAARAFWDRPSEEAAVAAAREIVSILKVRPQAFHKIPLEQRVRAVAGLAHPPDALADALVLALHVQARRELLVAFLDAVGVPHEQGMIPDDVEMPEVGVEAVRAAAPALVVAHGAEAVRVYWNALWLQDPERWGALETVAAEL